MKRSLPWILGMLLLALTCLPATVVGAAGSHAHQVKSAAPAHGHATRRRRSARHARSCRVHRRKRHSHHRCVRRHARRSHRRHARHSAGGTHPRHASRHAHATNPPRVTSHRPATASDSCPGANLRPDGGNLEVVRSATLCLVNGERARFGESPLAVDARLQGAAEAHSRDMVESDYFEHVSPGGQTLLARIRAAGYIPSVSAGFVIGENIAWGTLWLASPREIVKAWMASPGHRANILNGAYRDTGIGVDPALPRSMSHGQAGGMYTQDFGAILS